MINLYLFCSPGFGEHDFGRSVVSPILVNISFLE